MTAAEVIRSAMELPPAEREEVVDIRRGRVKMLGREEMDAFLDERRAKDPRR